MEYEKLAKKNRKKIVINESSSDITLNYGIDDIKTLIPHREPFLFLDLIEKINFAEETILGSKKINPDDPVFKGHFPDYPVYPGVYQIEMIGQLAIAYFSLLKKHSNEEARRDVRVLKVLHSLFQYEVLPNDEVKIACKVIEADEYKIKGMGQIIKDGNICSVVIAEFYFI